MFVLAGCGGGDSTGGARDSTGDGGQTGGQTTYALDGVWVIVNGSVLAGETIGVVRIDPSTREVAATIPSDEPASSSSLHYSPRSIAFCNGSVWVGSYAHDGLDRIDPSTMEVEPGEASGHSVTALGCGQGSLWAMSFDGLADFMGRIVVGGITGLSSATVWRYR
jgi:hypothetical protein